MNGPSHAKSAKGAKDGRIPVASELVSDVDVSGHDRREHGNVVGDKLRRYRGMVESSRASCLLLAILARFA
jgi:hypothetical protein